MIEKIGNKALEIIKEKAKKTILNPLNELVDTNISDITTTIGSFIVRRVRGKFQRSITFTVGIDYSDRWMEEALYGILYEYNNIRTNSKLSITNVLGVNDASSMYFQLDEGVHNLKYRKWDILLVIQKKMPQSANGRIGVVRTYQIISYDLSKEFVDAFERDMSVYRNSLLKIKSNSPSINIYIDGHEHDGYTYWEKAMSIPKRRLSSIYLPQDQKKLLVDTINNFFASKDLYHKHGIPWNLKILFYGMPGSGKSSLTKVIASEWNRNIYELNGGKNGMFIPNALTDNSPLISYPLYSISDIDKYPMLINEPDINLDKAEDKGAKDESLRYKQVFNNMINALDGITSGEGKIIVMTTNHIEKFSDTILRPGRIDLKMEIGALTVPVFRKYVYDLYGVILPKDIKLTKKQLTIPELQFDAIFMKLPADEFIHKYVK